MILDVVQAQEKLDHCVTLFSWGRYLLSTVGIWPTLPNPLVFAVQLCIFIFFLGLIYADFIIQMDLERFIMGVSELAGLMPLFCILLLLRFHRHSLATVINEIMEDFNVKKYKTLQEMNVFISFHQKARSFLTFVIINNYIAWIIYFFKPLLHQITEDAETRRSDSTLYQLPFGIFQFYEINDTLTYGLTFAYLMPFCVAATCLQSGSSALIITLVYHLSGQLSVLKLRIQNLSPSSSKCIYSLVKDHIRLLWIGDFISNSFSIILLCNILGVTFRLCCLGFGVLQTLASGENAYFLSFASYAATTILQLYVDCAVGEKLYTESVKLSNAFYECEWYTMAIEHTKMITFCIARCNTPICLTAGKFTIIRISSMTGVLKTTMGYLSLLRAVAK